MPQYIWDASDYDWPRGPMDLAAARAAGIAAFTHKATEGTTIRHVHLADALNRARAAGFELIGAYVVPRTPGNGGAGVVGEQVAYFLAYLDQAVPWWRDFPGFFLQVDTEHWSSGGAVYDAVSPSIGAQACALLRQTTGRWVIHYAPRWAYGDTIPGPDPLWASSYGANLPYPFPEAYPGDQAAGWAPYSGRTPTFLQYGSRLLIDHQPSCDVSAFRGTYDQLRALITGGTMTAPITPRQADQISNADQYGYSTLSEQDPIPFIKFPDGSTQTVPNQPLRRMKALQAAVDDLAAAVAKIPTTPAATVDAAAFVDALAAHPAVLQQLGESVAGAVVDLLIQIAASAHVTTPAAPAATS